MNGDTHEVNHDGILGDLLHASRVTLGPAIAAILQELHDAGPVADGEQWTIPVGMSCGFDGEVVIRVFSNGTCSGKVRR